LGHLESGHQDIGTSDHRRIAKEDREIGESLHRTPISQARYRHRAIARIAKIAKIAETENSILAPFLPISVIRVCQL
jgi:hypothetical protein